MSEENENLIHLNQIEGLMSQVNGHIEKIVVGNPQQKQMYDTIVEELDMFQKTTLHDMRILFEGD